MIKQYKYRRPREPKYYKININLMEKIVNKMISLFNAIHDKLELNFEEIPLVVDRAYTDRHQYYSSDNIIEDLNLDIRYTYSNQNIRNTTKKMYDLILKIFEYLDYQTSIMNIDFEENMIYLSISSGEDYFKFIKKSLKFIEDVDKDVLKLLYNKI